MKRREMLLDLASLGLAACLFAAPWLLGFLSIMDARRDAWVCGGVIILAAAAAIMMRTA